MKMVIGHFGNKVSGAAAATSLWSKWLQGRQPLATTLRPLVSTLQPFLLWLQSGCKVVASVVWLEYNNMFTQQHGRRLWSRHYWTTTVSYSLRVTRRTKWCLGNTADRHQGRHEKDELINDSLTGFESPNCLWSIYCWSTFKGDMQMAEWFIDWFWVTKPFMEHILLIDI